MTKHTPGPWGIGDSDLPVIDLAVCHKNPGYKHSTIARFSRHGFLSFSEIHANAILIAEAPELLEALQQAEMAMAGYMHRNDVIDAALVKARSAIEKATIGELDAAMKENP